MDDVDAVQELWLRAAEEGHHNGTTFRLTPRAGNVPSDVIWIDYLLEPSPQPLGQRLRFVGKSVLREALISLFKEYYHALQGNAMKSALQPGTKPRSDSRRVVVFLPTASPWLRDGISPAVAAGLPSQRHQILLHSGNGCKSRATYSPLRLIRS